jgi:hypothetical protein
MRSEGSAGTRKPDQETEWDRLERRSIRIALAIALMPIPVALVISWALGSPPWRDRSHPASEEPPGEASQAPGWPGPGPH